MRAIIVLITLLALLPASIYARSSSGLSLEQAIGLAVKHDPWLESSRYQQQALTRRSQSAASLPDPMMSVGLANLPTDTFAFDQEAMTQLKVGISQQFPRGDSLALNEQRLSLIGQQQELARLDRTGRLAVMVTEQWLSVWQANETIRLIENDRKLFEQLVDVAQSSYSTAMGKTRQQDLIRAQLELTRLEDRLTALQSRQAMAESQLQGLVGNQSEQQFSAMPIAISGPLPTISLVRPMITDDRQSDPATAMLIAHPAVQLLDLKIRAASVDVSLAKQKYKPQWGLNASYGYRQDSPLGPERADFFSVGVSFDLPLFTENRQDQDVKAAVADGESIKHQRYLLLRQLRTGYETANAKLERLDQRLELYRDRLLSEMAQQAEAALNAYTNDNGDFAEVVRARIAVLNTHIDYLAIQVERLNTIAQLNYFVSPASPTGEAS